MDLYSHTTDGTFANYNDGNDWWYAHQFVCGTSGVPTEIDVYLEATSAGTGDALYIRGSKSASAPNYGSATGIGWSASGIQTISLGGGALITSGNTYYVCIHVTSGTNFPKFQIDSSLDAAFQSFKSASAGTDPSADWFKNYPTFVIRGTAAPAENTRKGFVFPHFGVRRIVRTLAYT